MSATSGTSTPPIIFNLYDHLPTVSVKKGYDGCDWDSGFRLRNGELEANLSQIFQKKKNGFQNGAVRLAVRFGPSTGDARTESWNHSHMESLLPFIEQYFRQLPSRQCDEVNGQLRRLSEAITQDVVSAVSKILKDAGCALPQTLSLNRLETFSIGEKLSIPVPSCSEEVQKLNTSGKRMFGTKTPFSPEYAFSFEGKEPIFIHTPILQKAALREGKKEIPFFKTLLENSASGAQPYFSEIDGKKYSYEAFQAFVHYLYTGEIHCEAKTLPNLMALAGDTGVKSLADAIGAHPVYKAQKMLTLFQSPGEGSSVANLRSLTQRITQKISEAPLGSLQQRVKDVVESLENFGTAFDAMIAEVNPEAEKVEELFKKRMQTLLNGMHRFFADQLVTERASVFVANLWREKIPLPFDPPKNPNSAIEVVVRSQKTTEVDGQGAGMVEDDSLYAPDITLVLGDESIPIHSQFVRSALAVRESEDTYLQTYLNMAAGGSNDNADAITLPYSDDTFGGIDISDYKVTILKALKNYIYTGMCSCTREEIPYLYCIADMLGFLSLKRGLFAQMQRDPTIIRSFTEESMIRARRNPTDTRGKSLEEIVTSFDTDIAHIYRNHAFFQML